MQDIKSWVLPPGLYRICKPGEGFNSFRNYITVQINEGELTQLELIFDKAGGDLVSGGIKTLNTRIKVGSHWSFGTRIGGNLNLTRVTEENGEKREATRVSSDIRLKLLFDNARYLGTSEFILQDNFSKDNGRPFIVASDFAQVRTNWIRRLNNWLGPYVRSSVETHLFPRKADRDSIYLIKPHEVPTDSLKNPSDTKKIKYDTLLTTGAKGFVIRPALDPTKYSEGMGVNVELFSRYYLEANTQLGFAGRQTVSLNNFATNDGIHYSAEKSVLEVGIENTFNATLRLGSQATLDLNSVIFAVNSDPRDIRLDDFTADLRFFLSRNLEVGYIFHIQESVGLAKNRYPSTHSLSLRLSFNY